MLTRTLAYLKNSAVRTAKTVASQVTDWARNMPCNSLSDPSQPTSSAQKEHLEDLKKKEQDSKQMVANVRGQYYGGPLVCTDNPIEGVQCLASPGEGMLSSAAQSIGLNKGVYFKTILGQSDAKVTADHSIQWYYQKEAKLLQQGFGERCLSAKDPKKTGAPVQVQTCKPTDPKQKWTFNKKTRQLQVENGKCLKVAKENVGAITSDCDDTDGRQKFSIVDMSTEEGLDEFGAAITKPDCGKICGGGEPVHAVTRACMWTDACRQVLTTEAAEEYKDIFQRRTGNPSTWTNVRGKFILGKYGAHAVIKYIHVSKADKDNLGFRVGDRILKYGKYAVGGTWSEEQSLDSDSDVQNFDQNFQKWIYAADFKPDEQPAMLVEARLHTHTRIGDRHRYISL